MSNIDGDGDNDEGIDPNGDDVPLPALKMIWDCNNIKKTVVTGVDGVLVAGWSCSWCPNGGRFFKGDNAT